MQIDDTTTLRDARHGLWLVSGSYFVDVLLLCAYVALDRVSPGVLVFYAGWAVVHSAVMAGLASTRAWQRFGMARTAFWQVMAVGVMMTSLIAFAPGASPLFVSGLFIVMAFSAVALDVRRIVAVIAVIGIGLLVAFGVAPAGEAILGASTEERLLAAVVIACGLVRCLSLGVWARSMRERLVRKSDELADSRRKLDELAAIDPLTGALNRRRMLEVVSQQAGEAPAAACVAMLDLDHFQIVNDRFGRETGDRVLRRFAQIVASELRDADTIGRYGGEEFLIVLRNATLSSAPRILDRIRHAVARFDWSSIADGLHVTVSIGAAHCRGGESPDVLLGRADVALHQAKREGRDRVQLDTA